MQVKKKDEQVQKDKVCFFPLKLPSSTGSFRKRDVGALNLGGDLGLGVGDLDAELLGAGNDVDALAGRDGRGNLGGVGAVVHEEEVEVLDVVDEEGLVARGHHEAGLLVGTVADLGHGDHAAEATADTTVNTLGLSP